MLPIWLPASRARNRGRGTSRALSELKNTGLVAWGAFLVLTFLDAPQSVKCTGLLFTNVGLRNSREADASPRFGQKDKAPFSLTFDPQTRYDPVPTVGEFSIIMREVTSRTPSRPTAGVPGGRIC